MEDDERLFRCDCQGHGIVVSTDKDEDFLDPAHKRIFIEFWARNPYTSRGLKARLKNAWLVLREKDIAYDDEVLTLEDAKALGEHLICLVEDE